MWHCYCVLFWPLSGMLQQRARWGLLFHLVANITPQPASACLSPCHPPYYASSAALLQVRVPAGERIGPDGLPYKHYLLCQVVAVETRQPGYYKWVQLQWIDYSCTQYNDRLNAAAGEGPFLVWCRNMGAG